MPFDPVVAGIASGAAAAGLARRAYKWLDSDYLSDRSVNPVTSAMPIARRARVPNRFRRRRRRRYVRRRRTRFTRAVQPQMVYRTLKSVIQWTFNAGAGAISAVTCTVNSINDPTDAMGAGRPLGYTEYAALYDRYCVVGGYITMEGVSVDASIPLVVGINVQRSSTLLTTFEHYKELPHTADAIITPDMDKFKLYLPFRVAPYFGKPKILSQENLCSDFGSNPVDTLRGHFYVQPVDKTSDPGNVHTVITIVQRVALFKPRIPARS